MLPSKVHVQVASYAECPVGIPVRERHPFLGLLGNDAMALGPILCIAARASIRMPREDGSIDEELPERRVIERSGGSDWVARGNALDTRPA